MEARGPMPLSERGRILRVAMAVADRHKVEGNVCPGGMIQQCKSLVALGGMAQVGLNCRPYFMARQAMQRHLALLQRYNTGRWTQNKLEQLKNGDRQPARREAQPNPKAQAKKQWTDDQAIKMTFRTGICVKTSIGKQLSGMGATRRMPTWYAADYFPELSGDCAVQGRRHQGGDDPLLSDEGSNGQDS